jgi:hypothetical protein
LRLSYEQALTTGSNVRAVLDVVGRPETLGGCIVALIEEHIESFENQLLVARLVRVPAANAN